MTATSSDSASLAECLALLSTPRTGRIVYTVRALPAVMPVRLGLAGSVVVVDSFVDPVLARSVAGSVVALQTDELDALGSAGWSLTLTGHAREVTDLLERQALLGMHRSPDAMGGLLLVSPSLCDLWRLPSLSAPAIAPVQRQPDTSEGGQDADPVSPSGRAGEA